jgi:hypothetical protein
MNDQSQSPAYILKLKLLENSHSFLAPLTLQPLRTGQHLPVAGTQMAVH